MGRIAKVGQRYRHFKGNLVEIIAICKHTETLENLIIYRIIETVTPEPFPVWARPADMFMEEVDKDKYPNATQIYRFELVDEVNPI